MSVISVRLDDDTQAALQDAAARSGVGLSTYLRRMAEAEARRVRRERIRDQSRAVARYVAQSAEAHAFYEHWGNADDNAVRAVKLDAGRIVLVDWRDALPREASKRGRPAIVVEDGELFDEAYPNLILVPLAEDPHLAIEDLSVRIEPTPENGCAKTCHALAHHVTATSKSRVLRDTGSSVTPAQLARIRRLIALSIGVDV